VKNKWLLHIFILFLVLTGCASRGQETNESASEEVEVEFFS